MSSLIVFCPSRPEERGNLLLLSFLFFGFLSFGLGVVPLLVGTRLTDRNDYSATSQDISPVKLKDSPLCPITVTTLVELGPKKETTIREPGTGQSHREVWGLHVAHRLPRILLSKC